MLVNDGGTATQPRAPGHERPHAALCAARHGRLSAASTAPGADIPRATSARAPGQYCQSAARAPGHGRPLATTAGAPCRDRLSAALLAPGADAVPATTATAPRHHRPSAAPIATVALPAGPHRLRQEGLPRTPANPRTLNHSLAPQITTHAGYSQVSPSPCTAGEIQGGQTQPSASRKPPLSTMWRGAGGKAIPSPSTHQVHPAIQVPPYPRSCSTACTGFSRRHHPRAPPRPPAETYLCQPLPPSPPWWRGAGGEVRPAPAVPTCR